MTPAEELRYLVKHSCGLQRQRRCACLDGPIYNSDGEDQRQWRKGSQKSEPRLITGIHILLRNVNTEGGCVKFSTYACRVSVTFKSEIPLLKTLVTLPKAMVMNMLIHRHSREMIRFEYVFYPLGFRR